jgi:hypothetical protein
MATHIGGDLDAANGFLALDVEVDAACFGADFSGSESPFWARGDLTSAITSPKIKDRTVQASHVVLSVGVRYSLDRFDCLRGNFAGKSRKAALIAAW